ARRALREFDIAGGRTGLPFHRDLLEEPALVSEDLGIFTDWVDHNYRPSAAQQVDKVEAIYSQRRNVAVEIDGRLINVGFPTELLSAGAPAGGSSSSAGAGTDSDAAEAAGENAVTASFEANLVAWNVAEGDEVAVGDDLATVEAMKMESSIKAARAGKISLRAAVGDRLSSGQVIATIN
ncbi:MAG: acetyl/propionyl-CoA carboxylase subunit alpha, partial [Corynebacterium flavescens]|uniref:biotin/lipoyl-containing protein n=1 Tax=Corynebacterium flavescens TaxID=28028 RepID=UPI0026491638